MAAYVSNFAAAGPDHSSALSSDLGVVLLLIVTFVVKKWTLFNGLPAVGDVQLDARCCCRMDRWTKSAGDAEVHLSIRAGDATRFAWDLRCLVHVPCECTTTHDTHATVSHRRCERLVLSKLTLSAIVHDCESFTLVLWNSTNLDIIRDSHGSHS